MNGGEELGMGNQDGGQFVGGNNGISLRQIELRGRGAQPGGEQQAAGSQSQRGSGRDSTGGVNPGVEGNENLKERMVEGPEQNHELQRHLRG